MGRGQGTARSLASARGPHREEGRGAVEGQVDAEPAPHAGALDLDPAAVVGDDAVADAQAQAGPAAERLGGEERVEDPRQHVGRDAAAVVGDLDDDLAVDRPGRRPGSCPSALAAVLDRLQAFISRFRNTWLSVRRGALQQGERAVVAVDRDLLAGSGSAEHPEALVERRR